MFLRVTRINKQIESNNEINLFHNYGTFIHSQNEIKSIDFDDYSSLSKSKDFLIVDVRTPEEHKISRINNSININFYDEKFINMFKDRLDKHTNLL